MFLFIAPHRRARVIGRLSQRVLCESATLAPVGLEFFFFFSSFGSVLSFRYISHHFSLHLLPTFETLIFQSVRILCSLPSLTDFSVASLSSTPSCRRHSSPRLSTACKRDHFKCCLPIKRRIF